MQLQVSMGQHSICSPSPHYTAPAVHTCHISARALWGRRVRTAQGNNGCYASMRARWVCGRGIKVQRVCDKGSSQPSSSRVPHKRDLSTTSAASEPASSELIHSSRSKHLTSRGCLVPQEPME